MRALARNDGGHVEWFVVDGKSARELAAHEDGRGIGRRILRVIGLADGNFVYARDDDGLVDLALHHGKTAEEIAFADNVRGVGTFLDLVPMSDGGFVYAREDQGKIDLFQYNGTTLEEIAVSMKVCNAAGFEAITAIDSVASDGTNVTQDAVMRPVLYKRLDADRILQTPPAHQTRIRTHNGAPRIWVDDRPITGLGWGAIKNQNQSDSTIRDMSLKTGFPCYRVVVGHSVEDELFRRPSVTRLQRTDMVGTELSRFLVHGPADRACP